MLFLLFRHIFIQKRICLRNLCALVIVLYNVINRFAFFGHKIRSVLAHPNTVAKSSRRDCNCVSISLPFKIGGVETQLFTYVSSFQRLAVNDGSCDLVARCLAGNLPYCARSIQLDAKLLLKFCRCKGFRCLIFRRLFIPWAFDAF